MFTDRKGNVQSVHELRLVNHSDGNYRSCGQIHQQVGSLCFSC